MTTSASSWQVRGRREDDEPPLRRLDDLAFGFTVPDARWADEISTLEPDRTIVVTDPAAGDAIVGTTGAFSFDLSVPGGRSVAAAGVSWVAVSPTHRRRGILRTLMNSQLADIAARGEPLAVLWCSEATIYGRFGYGPASTESHLTVDRHRSGIDPALLAPAEPLQAEVADPVESLAEVEALYEAVRRTRPGMPRRTDAWQRVAVADHEVERAGASALRAVLFRDRAGSVRAAARYRVEGWAAETPERPRRTRVSELYADSPQSSAVAWSWLGQLDLVGGYRAGARPVDDPLLLQLADLRAARVETGDALWARLVDLPRALTARGYATTTEVVLEVTDPVLSANTGRWRLQTAPSGATATRTDAAPDLALDTAVLARAYLGLGGSLLRSLHAGLLTEHRAGAVAELSRAFDADLAPWCPVHF